MEYNKQRTEQDIIEFLREGSFIKTYDDGSIWFTDKAARALSKCPPEEDLRTEILNHLTELGSINFKYHEVVKRLYSRNRSIAILALLLSLSSLILSVVRVVATFL